MGKREFFIFFFLDSEGEFWRILILKDKRIKRR